MKSLGQLRYQMESGNEENLCYHAIGETILISKVAQEGLPVCMV